MKSHTRRRRKYSSERAENELRIATFFAAKKEEEKTNLQNTDAKSGQNELRVHKIKKELTLLKKESQPRCPLGLSHWQKKKLQKLSARELEKKNMAWVPKKNSQTKYDVQASILENTTKVKKEKSSYKILSRRFPSSNRNLRLAHHSYSSNMTLMPLSWNSSSGMIGYPPWTYFDPWMNTISYITIGDYQVTINLISSVLVANSRGQNI